MIIITEKPQLRDQHLEQEQQTQIVETQKLQEQALPAFQRKEMIKLVQPTQTHLNQPDLLGTKTLTEMTIVKEDEVKTKPEKVDVLECQAFLKLKNFKVKEA